VHLVGGASPLAASITLRTRALGGVFARPVGSNTGVYGLDTGVYGPPANPQVFPLVIAVRVRSAVADSNFPGRSALDFLASLEG
jgi:hypothetical protein